MEIERTEDSIIVKVPKTVNVENLQKVIDYLRYQEATAESQASQEEVDKLANESKVNWWKENEYRFLK